MGNQTRIERYDETVAHLLGKLYKKYGGKKRMVMLGSFLNVYWLLYLVAGETFLSSIVSEYFIPTGNNQMVGVCIYPSARYWVVECLYP